MNLGLDELLTESTPRRKRHVFPCVVSLLLESFRSNLCRKSQRRQNSLVRTVMVKAVGFCLLLFGDGNASICFNNNTIPVKNEIGVRPTNKISKKCWWCVHSTSYRHTSESPKLEKERDRINLQIYQIYQVICSVRSSRRKSQGVKTKSQWNLIH